MAPSVQNRIQGSLYGQAIGDALGMPSELWTKNKVVDFFGWIDDFLDGPAENEAASEFTRGQYTDDTSQGIAIMDAIIECNGSLDANVIGKHLVKWGDSIDVFQKNILGPTSKEALLALKGGADVESIVSTGVTNGSAMRVFPVGLLLPSSNREAFIQGVVASSAPTHKSDIAIAGAVAIAWCISRAVEGADWDTIKKELPPLVREVQTRYESTFSPSLACRIEYALDVAREGILVGDTAALDLVYSKIGAGMNIIESVPAAIAMVEISQTKAKRCAVLCANLGGDTDTIGAMSTSICGAIHGVNAFDDKDMHLVDEANSVSMAKYGDEMYKFRQQHNK